MAAGRIASAISHATGVISVKNSDSDMKKTTGSPTGIIPTEGSSVANRRRDADATRSALVASASRRRFATLELAIGIRIIPTICAALTPEVSLDDDLPAPASRVSDSTGIVLRLISSTLSTTAFHSNMPATAVNSDTKASPLNTVCMNHKNGR